MDFFKGEILVFDKPLEWTSFDVVNKVKAKTYHALKLKKLKVGHAGTLDPLATGVLIVCTGKSTKLISQLQNDVKEYVATLKLGATTPSFDLETEEDAQFETEHITRELVEEIMPQFLGEIQQVPPAYSAVKVNGKRAYDLARKGKEVELKPKLLAIDEIEILSFDKKQLQLRIVCSKGTYIRALARDIGKALNSGAFLTGLIRTRIGDYKVEDAMSVEDFEENIEKLKQNTDLSV